MRLLLIASLLFLSACTHSLQKSKNSDSAETPPINSEVYKALFAMHKIDLKNEPLCGITPINDKNDTESTLFSNYLSSLLSLAHNNNNTVAIASSCEASKTELENGKLKDIWDCKFQLTETNEQGDFISSAMIAVGLDMRTLKYQPKTLRCF